MGKPWEPQRTERFKQLWADESLTLRQIAKAIGLAYDTSVAHRAVELGLPARHPRNAWTELENERLRQLWAKGYRPKRIGKILGRPAHSVTGHATRIGLPRRKNSCTEWTRERDAELKRLCEIEPQLSLKQIALQIGCTYSALSMRRMILNLPVRSRHSFVSLHAWNSMNEAPRRDLPEHSIPVRRHLKIRRKPKLWGTKSF
ncbi:hypothetical protein AB7M49_006093 [Bradyrhizobium elkanii]